MASLITVARSAPIVLMVAKVYIPVLFPLTFGIAFLAVWMDRALGWGAFQLPDSLRWLVAAAVFCVGALLWLWTYRDLVRHGQGSPSPVAGRTTRLAVEGVYAYSRNPSLYGKLLGVWAVGIALGSPTFCLILVPLLLAYALIEKVVRQEPQLIAIFGEDYLRYRAVVPLFLPWGILFPSRRYPPSPGRV